MTLLLPHLFNFIIKIPLAIMNAINYAVKYLEQDFPNELLSWSEYILIPLFTAILVHCFTFLHGILLVPFFLKLVWHPNGQSIIDMLRNPEGNGRLVSYNKQHCRRRWRERARPVLRWVWRQKPCRLRFCWSTLAPNETSIIWGYGSRLCLFSYYQIHPTRINKTDGTPSSENGVTADTKIIATTWNPRFPSQCIKSIQRGQPTTPPNEFISAFLVMLMTIGIQATLTGIKCHHILNSAIPTLSLPSEGATVTWCFDSFKRNC